MCLLARVAPAFPGVSPLPHTVWSSLGNPLAPPRAPTGHRVADGRSVAQWAKSPGKSPRLWYLERPEQGV